MAKRRRPSWRKVKRHYNYTADEAARALGCHKGTVRRWLKDGLPALTDQRPALILGDDLIAFLKARAKSKRRCKPDECYCLKCRAPRKAAGAMADLIDRTATGGNLRALCEECETVMHKRVSHRQVAALDGILDVRKPANGARETTRLVPGAAQAQCWCPATERQTDLKDCPEPRLNDHLPEAPEDYA